MRWIGSSRGCGLQSDQLYDGSSADYSPAELRCRCGGRTGAQAPGLRPAAAVRRRAAALAFRRRRTAALRDSRGAGSLETAAGREPANAGAGPAGRYVLGVGSFGVTLPRPGARKSSKICREADLVERSVLIADLERIQRLGCTALLRSPALLWAPAAISAQIIRLRAIEQKDRQYNLQTCS